MKDDRGRSTKERLSLQSHLLNALSFKFLPVSMGDCHRYILTRYPTPRRMNEISTIKGQNRARVVRPSPECGRGRAGMFQTTEKL